MEKRFKKGLVLGKFMPPHNGHLFLINSALEQCEEVVLMVCSLKSEPINGILRYNWLKMIYEGQKNLTIFHVEEELPQKPEECTSTDVFYNQYWVPVVYKRAPDIDVVFTSESYGDEFAQYLDVEHVLVDIDRNTYPVSGTKVRTNPMEYWNFIPDIVKEYYTKRIVIMGPESTGKSTLVKNLAYEYGTSYVPEYGREYTETIKKGSELTAEDFYHIAVTHEDRMLESHINNRMPFLFIDTEAITTKTFGQLYLGEFNDERVDEIIRHQWFDLIILLDVDVPWVNDGTRDFPTERQKHFDMLEKELWKSGKKFVVIRGNDYVTRFQKAKEEVDKLFA
jgi:HTH-type transcriptional repressor of NAD biosynthesis genes